MKTYMKRGLIYLSLITLGFFIAKWMVPNKETPMVEKHTHGEEFTCSMHPQIRLPEMGKCPICGMGLIPVTKKLEKKNEEAVAFSEEAVKLASIHTQIVGEGPSGSTIRLTGKVQPDERLVFTQTAHFGGRLESFSVKYPGQKVGVKEMIGTIYSPELLTAQQELQSAYANRESQPQWYASARAKLRNWKLSDDEIDRLQSTTDEINVPLRSDFSGVVVKIIVSEGDYVKAGSLLYEVADLSKVWMMMDVYESQLDVISVGQEIRCSVPALGKEFTGKIEFIDPFIDPVNRVAKARISMTNPGMELKPEMLVSGSMQTESRISSKIVIPKTAVLWTGKRSIVYVKNQKAKSAEFELREVTLGADLGTQYEVISGLENGEEIAVNGAFTIDAAAQLEGKPSMLDR